MSRLPPVRKRRDNMRVHFFRPSRPRRIQYDYLISTDADWDTIPAGLLSGGGTVAVASGNYTTKTITGVNPSSTLTFTALNPSDKPVIDRIRPDGSGNLEFENLKITTGVWADGNNISAPGAAVGIYGTCGAITFRGCRLAGNYQGVVDDPTFNVNTTYPEFASIFPVFNSGGVITSLTIGNANVSGLVADGTHDLVFDAAITGATGTFTVSGGSIVSTSLTNGGTSGYNDTTSAGVRSKLISWAGQRRFINWAPNVIRCNTGGTVNDLRFYDCEFNLFNNGIKPNASPETLKVIGCTFTRIYQDASSFGVGDDPFSIEFTDNFASLPFSGSNDPGDPHSDFFQLFMDDIPPTLTTVDHVDAVIERNIAVTGASRGKMQGFIIADNPAGVYYSNMRIVGNCIVNAANSLGIDIEGAKDCYVANNTCIRWDTADARNTSAVTITVGSLERSGNNVMWNNITESITNTPTTSVDVSNQNVALGLNGATLSYGSVFNDPTATRESVAQIVSAYTSESAYTGKGAFGNSSYINHVARTTNKSVEPCFLKFDELASQSTSTLVTSNWSRLIGGADGRAISVSGGEYRVADDSSGTNATAWGSAASTINPGKFVQTRHTTSGSGSTVTTTTLTVGAYSFVFQSTTASILAFTTIDNGGTAYSRFPLSGFSTTANVRKVAIAVRFRPDAITANANIAADSTAVRFRLYMPDTAQYRFITVGSTRFNLRPALTPTSVMKTHFITMDFTNTTAGQGCYWATDADGVLLNNTPGTGGTFDTSASGGGPTYGDFAVAEIGSGGALLGASANHIGLFGEGDGGGVLLDGAIEFFWMDWGGSAYSIPDITQSSVRNLWSADNIESDGSGPTGSQPKIFYTSDAAGWNAGLSNLGSLTLALTKQAGTYA